MHSVVAGLSQQPLRRIESTPAGVLEARGLEYAAHSGSASHLSRSRASSRGISPASARSDGDLSGSAASHCDLSRFSAGDLLYMEPYVRASAAVSSEQQPSFSAEGAEAASATTGPASLLFCCLCRCALKKTAIAVGAHLTGKRHCERARTVPRMRCSLTLRGSASAGATARRLPLGLLPVLNLPCLIKAIRGALRALQIQAARKRTVTYDDSHRAQLSVPASCTELLQLRVNVPTALLHPSALRLRYADETGALHPLLRSSDLARAVQQLEDLNLLQLHCTDWNGRIAAEEARQSRLALQNHAARGREESQFPATQTRAVQQRAVGAPTTRPLLRAPARPSGAAARAASAAVLARSVMSGASSTSSESNAGSSHGSSGSGSDSSGLSPDPLAVKQPRVRPPCKFYSSDPQSSKCTRPRCPFPHVAAAAASDSHGEAKAFEVEPGEAADLLEDDEQSEWHTVVKMARTPNRASSGQAFRGEEAKQPLQATPRRESHAPLESSTAALALEHAPSSSGSSHQSEQDSSDAVPALHLPSRFSSQPPPSSPPSHYPLQRSYSAVSSGDGGLMSTPPAQHSSPAGLLLTQHSWCSGRGVYLLEADGSPSSAAAALQPRSASPPCVRVPSQSRQSPLLAFEVHAQRLTPLSSPLFAPVDPAPLSSVEFGSPSAQHQSPPPPLLSPRPRRATALAPAALTESLELAQPPEPPEPTHATLLAKVFESRALSGSAGAGGEMQTQIVSMRAGAHACSFQPLMFGLPPIDFFNVLRT